MTTHYCDLCKVSGFVQPVSWDGKLPDGWNRVNVKANPFPTILCPACCAVARALQKTDGERTATTANTVIPHARTESGAEINKKYQVHKFTAGEPYALDRPCIECGLSDRHPIHKVGAC